MGIQPVRDVELVRHAYVDPAHQGRGVGSAALLQEYPTIPARQVETSVVLVGPEP